MKETELRQLRDHIDEALATFRHRESRLTSRELRFQRRLQLLYDELTEEIDAKQPKGSPPAEPQGYV